MTAPPDGRHYRRISVAYHVKVVADDRIIAFPMAINLSMGGILVGGRERLPVGSHCGVAILIKEAVAGKRIVARGTVVRVDQRGMAIAFSKALDAISEEALRDLIRSLSPGAEQALDPPTSHPADLQPQEPSPVLATPAPAGLPRDQQDPEASLAGLMDRIKPGSGRAGESGEAWEPPVFEQYEDIRTWMKDAVMSATLYERYPDGRWTIQLLLKEQNPGTYRYIVL
jgi:hypothetical protein